MPDRSGIDRLHDAPGMGPAGRTPSAPPGRPGEHPEREERHERKAGRAPHGAKVAVVAGEPASKRALRSQGRKTMRKLLDAAMVVFARRGYHAARVDDIVKVARTSHGTFYLYFSNKEDLLRALVAEAGEVVAALDDALGPVGPDAAGGRSCARGWSGSRSRGSATPRCCGPGPTSS